MGEDTGYWMLDVWELGAGGVERVRLQIQETRLNALSLKNGITLVEKLRALQTVVLLHFHPDLQVSIQVKTLKPLLLLYQE